MNGDFLTTDEEMITLNNDAYGSNRVTYEPIVMGLCGNTQSYNTGALIEQAHKQISYDVTQKFPENEVSAVLKSTQTELPQVHGAPIEFLYNQYAEAVEFIRSNMTNINVTNINAGIIKELMKKYDYQGYIGINGNVGIKNNPNAVSSTATWSDYDSLKTAIDAAMAALKLATTITTDDYSLINFTYGLAIANILSASNAENVSNRERLEKAYAGLVLREIPQSLDDSDLFILSYRPMLTFHHASMPAVYNVEQGKHGLSDETLYTFESVAVQIEEAGAVQVVTQA